MDDAEVYVAISFNYCVTLSSQMYKLPRHDSGISLSVLHWLIFITLENYFKVTIKNK